MRCKQGDLAVIVGGDLCDQNILGSIIKLGKFDPEWAKPAWFYEGKRLFDLMGREIESFADDGLRPIRPSEGQDETLSWKDVPHKELA